MELIIKDHFELQLTDLEFDGIHYFKPHRQFTSFHGYKTPIIVDFCLVKDNVVVSMASVWISEIAGEIQLSFIETAKEHRKEGLASFLYDALISWMKYNHPGKSLYRGTIGVNCPPEFTEHVTNKLKQKQINYRQAGV